MTADYRTYLNPQTLAELGGLHLAARRIVEGYLTGLHRSPLQGHSVEFAEHREYVAGDDLRYVDWKVFGRSDRYYLKQYEEETNLSCYLFLDASESMSYRHDDSGLSKFDFARQLAAAIGYLVVQQQDAVGLAAFGDRITEFVRSAGTAPHLKQVIDVLQRTACGGTTQLGAILHDLAARVRKRSVVILISDLFAEREPLELGLKRLFHHGHDVRVLQVLDPAEIEFPFDEPTLFHGLEGLPDQMVEPRLLRDAYLAEFQRHRQEIRRITHELGFSYTLARTDRPVEWALRQLLTGRDDVSAAAGIPS
jgi:uncharacterized protein (DUF58 family)